MSEHPRSERIRLAMGNSRLGKLAKLLAIVLLFGDEITTQAVEPSDQPSPPKVEGPIPYVGPDTYLLLDAEGRPQPVLGMSYEKFSEVWKRSQHLDDSLTEPRFAIERIELNGQSQGDHAEFVAEITTRIQIAGQLQVPLGMANAILRDAPQIDLLDEKTTEPAVDLRGRVEFDEARGGYAAHFEGQPNQRFRIRLSMLVPLERDGNTTTLHLNCPNALVEKLSLDVPTPVVETSVSAGSLLSRFANDQDGTRLSVDGLGGDFALSWSTAEAERGDLATVLSATGEIAIDVDGHSIRANAKLTVGSYGGGFERFRVRLPPNAKLIQNRVAGVPSTAAAYRVTLETDQAINEQRDRQIVLVEFPEKQAGPVDVFLSTEQPIGLSGEDRAVEFAGFEVLGAVRQFGDVAVRVAEDWQLRWKVGPRVRQVDRVDLPSALASTQPAVAFQYDRQPWSLRATVTPRPLRVNVAPDYAMQIDSAGARLRARLVYQVPGARAFEFRVRLNGWELTADPVESNSLVDRDEVVVTRDGVLVLPLAQASPRSAEIAFTLRRSLPVDATDIALPLPVPEADAVAGAEVSVSAAPGLELVPDMRQSRGLSPMPISAGVQQPASDTAGDVFRYRSFLPDARLAVARTIRPREVVANVGLDLAINGRQIAATETIDFAVEHQPLDRFALDIPMDWTFGDGQVEIIPAPEMHRESAQDADVDIERLIIPIASELGGEDGESRRVELPLVQPRLGRFAVRIRFAAALPAELPVTGRLDLPVPLPADATIASQHIRFMGERRFSATLDSTTEPTSWTIAETPRNNMRPASSAIEFLASSREPSLPIMLEPILNDFSQATVVERVWLQSWRAGNTIQERAAFRFRTAGAAATVELPPQVPPEGVEVLIDGQLADVATRELGRLYVSLSPETNAESSHTLEVRYRRPARIGLVAREIFTPPQLVGSSNLNETYWHIVLPGDLHVVQSPSQLVPVHRWQWLSTFWGQRPQRSQADLETWVGASAQNAPAGGQNEYLFSGLAPIASIEVVSAPRWLIVLAASGAVLTATLVCLHLPAMRRPWVAIVASVALVAFAATYPAPALLLAQASVLGWIVATIAVAMRRRAAGGTTYAATTSGGSTNTRFRSPSRQESVVTPAIPPASATPTAPLSAPQVEG